MDPHREFDEDDHWHGSWRHCGSIHRRNLYDPINQGELPEYLLNSLTQQTGRYPLSYHENTPSNPKSHLRRPSSPPFSEVQCSRLLPHIPRLRRRNTRSIPLPVNRWELSTLPCIHHHSNANDEHLHTCSPRRRIQVTANYNRLPEKMSRMRTILSSLCFYFSLSS